MSHPTWSDAPMDRDELEQALEFDRIYAGCDKEADVLRAQVAALEADLAFVRECFETCLEEWREDRQAAYPLSGSGSLQALRDRIEDQARARQPQPEVPR